MEFLKYYLGKFVTVTTEDINFKFKYEQMNDYFTGFLTDINQYGITIVHNQTKCKNFIFFKYIVGIHEEQIVYPDTEENSKIIEEYRKEKPITADKYKVEPDKFVNIAALSELAQKAKSTSQ